MFRHGDPGGRMYGAVGTSYANLLGLWTDIQSAGTTALSNVAIVAGGARSGTGSCLSIPQPSSQYLLKTLDAQSTWGLAFAFKTNLLDNGRPIAGVRDSGSTQVDVRMTSGGNLTVTRNGTTLATSGSAITATNWWHVELKVVVHPTAGSYDLRINGVSVASATNVNTRATSNSTANQVFFGGFGGGGNASLTMYYDDIVVYDGQATDANGFSDVTGPIGDCGLVWLVPSGAGTTTQFTPDSGSNYARVNESTVDGDASYVESATVGQVDTYAMADLAGTVGAVKSLATVHFARKTDAGSRGMKAVLRSAGANATHATEVLLGSSYAYAWSTWGQNPNGGSPIAWTPSAVNALEAGQTVSS